MGKYLKIAHKVGSLLRRKTTFFAVTFSWETKALVVLHSYEQYVQALENLKDNGMCKRAEWQGERALQICDQSFDVVLVSYGDIRQNKFVFGESPLASEFGVCLFDYVFMFITKRSLSQSGAQAKRLQSGGNH